MFGCLVAPCSCRIVLGRIIWEHVSARYPPLPLACGGRRRAERAYATGRGSRVRPARAGSHVAAKPSRPQAGRQAGVGACAAHAHAFTGSQASQRGAVVRTLGDRLLRSALHIARAYNVLRACAANVLCCVLVCASKPCNGAWIVGTNKCVSTHWSTHTRIRAAAFKRIVDRALSRVSCFIALH